MCVEIKQEKWKLTVFDKSGRILVEQNLMTPVPVVVVQECPCPASVRSQENEDSGAETGLKFQEDSDSVEAKSE